MFGWKKRRLELLDEIEEHIGIETQANLDKGMSPAEAREAAKRKFGNVLIATEESRIVWGGVWLERLIQDLRYALRSFGGAPVYTASLVCTLALGLGCATTMLAIVESILMRPVSLSDSDHLVELYSLNGPDGTYSSAHALSYKTIDLLQRDAHAFSGVSGYNTIVRPVVTANGARVGVVAEITPNFFSMLNLSARLGRLIGTADANSAVAVVSNQFWRERMNADPTAIGSTIRVSGKIRTVIGVLPAGIHVPLGTGGSLVYLPISMNNGGEDEFLMDSAQVLARIRSGVSKQQALSQAESIVDHAQGTHANARSHLLLRSYQDVITGEMQMPLLAMLGGVGVLLLIACVNVANLQIGRGTSRISEMTVRSALGASFARLLQQMLTESILAAIAGAGLGSVLAWIAVLILRNAYGSQFPRFDELKLHAVVLGGAAVLAVLVGVFTSIAPALHVRRQTGFGVAARNTTRRSKIPGLLVGVQVALTCILLVLSGLFVRTLQALQDVKLGFDPNGVTTLVLVPEDLHQSPQVSRDIETRLLRRFEALPGVQSLTLQSDIPFSSFNVALNGTTELAGRAYQDGDSAFYSLVSTDFVRTSGIQLIRGRGFLHKDESGAPMTVLVNEAFAKKFLNGQDVIGKSLRFHRNPGETDADLPFTQPMIIVGEVENEVQGGELGAPYEPMVYLDYLQLPGESLLSQVFNMSAQYAIRSSLKPATIATEVRQTLKQEAPGMVEMSLGPMEQAISDSLSQRKLALRLVAGFGIAALILSAVGIYGVLAYSVALRRREIGIRMALGSSREQASGLVVRQAGAMVMFGFAPGIVGAWVAAYVLRSFLFGVSVFDARTLAIAGAVLLLSALLATCLPAWRAARVDPVETLRAE